MILPRQSTLELIVELLPSVKATEFGIEIHRNTTKSTGNRRKPRLRWESHSVVGGIPSAEACRHLNTLGHGGVSGIAVAIERLLEVYKGRQSRVRSDVRINIKRYVVLILQSGHLYVHTSINGWQRLLVVDNSGTSQDLLTDYRAMLPILET